MSESRKVLVQLLRDSPAKLREQLLLIGPPEVILSVCELALNVRENNIRIKLTKDQLQYIEQLSDRVVSLKRKRVFLARRQQGRQLLSTLLNIMK